MKFGRRFPAIALLLAGMLALTALVPVMAQQATPTPLPPWMDAPGVQSTVYVPSANGTVAPSGTASAGNQSFQGTATIVRAGTLFNYQVQNPDGENLGRVDNLLVNLQNGNVPYLVLAINGFLGSTENLTPVPLGKFHLDRQNQRLLLDMTAAQLSNMPQFNRYQWPDMTQQWDRQQEQFWATGGSTAVNLFGNVAGTPSPSGSATAVATAKAAAAPAGTATPSGAAAITNGQSLVRATKLGGMAVADSSGNVVGAIRDVYVNVDAGRVNFVVISRTGTQLANGKLVAVPFPALQYDAHNNRYSFTADRQALEGAPSFGPDNWPDTTNPKWDSQLRNYWENAGVSTGQAPQTLPATGNGSSRLVSGSLIRSDRLIGLEVVGSAGEDLGEVSDLLVDLLPTSNSSAPQFPPTNPAGSQQPDLRNARVIYAVIESGGFLGLGQDHVAVPFKGLQWQSNQGNLRLNASQEVLQGAPGFDSSALQNSQANWDAQIRQYWQKQNIGAGSSSAGSDGTVVVRMTRLEGAPVLDASRQEVGEFSAALLNLNDGSLRYGVVSYGGTLGIGEHQIAVPMNHFNATSEQGFLGNQMLALRLDVLQSNLQNAPSFNTNGAGATGWENQVSNYWQNLTAGQ